MFGSVGLGGSPKVPWHYAIPAVRSVFDFARLLRRHLTPPRQQSYRSCPSSRVPRGRVRLADGSSLPEADPRGRLCSGLWHLDYHAQPRSCVTMRLGSNSSWRKGGGVADGRTEQAVVAVVFSSHPLEFVKCSVEREESSGYYFWS